MSCTRGRWISALVILVGWALLGALPAAAFDAGYHFDLTRDVLVREGCGGDAIAVTQVGNFYNDGFEQSKTFISHPTARALLGTLVVAWAQVFGPGSLRDASDAYLHFDDLNNREEIAAVWDKLVRNTRAAAAEMERRHDPLGLLILLGMSSHQAQDFYAHSNWAELDLGGDATWFEVPAAALPGPVYTTGSRGGQPHDRLHKDDATRPHFERAYREAFYATWQWVYLVRSWVSPEFWREAMAYRNADVYLEHELVRYISWYVGHWKGLSSKSYDDGLITTSAYVSTGGREFIAKWKELCPLLVQPPTGPAVTVSPEPVPAQRWLRLDFTSVYQTDDDLFWSIDSFGDPDFYARVRVNGLEYLQAMHEDDSFIRPANWLTLAPLSPAGPTVRVEIAIWDEDVAGGTIGLRGGDDHCDITRDLGRRDWFLDGITSYLAERRSFHCDGFRYDAGWTEPDGDGDEAACDFTLVIQQPARRLVVARPGLRLATFPPPAPIVTDEGECTARPDQLAMHWTVPLGVGCPPVLEYQYRLRDLDTPLGDWQSLPATQTSLLSRLSLRDDHTYYLELKARNEVGWSPVGVSDGITADLQGPRVAFNSVTQVPPGGEAPPNSLRLSVVGEDRGRAGFDRFLLWINLPLETRGDPRRSPRLPVSLNLFKADLKRADLPDGAIVLPNLPGLYAGTYTLRLQGRDLAGNLGEPVTTTCTVRYTDSTPPPAPRPRVANSRPLQLTWEPVRDPESGVVEYQVAVGSLLASPERPDLLRWQSVGTACEYRHPSFTLPARCRVWVKARNGANLETVGVLASSLLTPATPATTAPRVRIPPRLRLPTR